MKWREGWSLEQLFSADAAVWKWWQQCVTEAAGVDKMPVLTIKRNNIVPLVVIPASDYMGVLARLPGTRSLVAMEVRCPDGLLTVVLQFDDWLALATAYYKVSRS